MTRILVALIRLYRRWLSGRGPLRRVRCTFGHAESCSAYGLRAALEAPSLGVALGRIRRRLRRCRAASMYELAAPGARSQLGWGADHDRPLDELVGELAADGEHAAARATVLATREAVSRYRGDLADVLALRQARAGLPPAQVLVRRARPGRRLRGITTSTLQLT